MLGKKVAADEEEKYEKVRLDKVHFGDGVNRKDFEQDRGLAEKRTGQTLSVTPVE
ncbi:hypothetical protein GCM10009119_29880 [Algoriphagus jejuensis]|uniref:Uncharacterized protein n=1 Tax=Algoriphagus jejuensis TaxID=419934 RepID=A0ABP3YF11_9BACT